MPANTQDGTTALSSRARFCAIIFCRVRPDNVANLHCKLSLLGTSRRSIRPMRFGGTVCTCLHHLRCAARGCVQRMLQIHGTPPSLSILDGHRCFPPASALGMVPILLLRKCRCGRSLPRRWYHTVFG